jgi:ATP-dependent helicase HrpA
MGDIRKELKADLREYIDLFINDILSFDRLRQYPRYLKAFSYRIQRAFNEPFKYREKRGLLRMYHKKVVDAAAKVPFEKKKNVNQLMSMYNEFAVSLFAQQEVKTLFPVSEKRLDKMIEDAGC